MSELFTKIQNDVGEENLGRSCSEGGCRVYMTDIPSSRLIVNLEKVFKGRKLSGNCCDFILFLRASGIPLVIAPLELKGGESDTSHAAEQLQAGAKFAEDLISENHTPIMRPVLIYRKGLHPKQRRDLNRAKIRFRGIDLSIKTARCNQPRNLARALSPHVSA